MRSLNIHRANDYPMIFVSWHDAVAYAKWAGKRLPTEAEWEYSVRGGLTGKRYSWGDQISHEQANYSGVRSFDMWEKCSPVGSFVANSYGLSDMAGNVWEWCNDWYAEDSYSISLDKDPIGPKRLGNREYYGEGLGITGHLIFV